MEQNKGVRPNILVRPAGVPPNKPVIMSSVSSSRTGPERKVYIVKGNVRIPVTAVSTIKPPQIPLPESREVKVERTTPPQRFDSTKEIKEEPLEEDTQGAIASIIRSKPINLQDFVRPSLPPGVKSYFSRPSQVIKDVKEEQSPELILRLNSKAIDEQAPCTSNMDPFLYAPGSNNHKRNRKPTRHDDYVYENSEFRDEADEYESHQLSAKKSRIIDQPDGCRCEYIVPELEQKMDRMMEKMHFIETLAKSMLVKEQMHETEKSAELQSAKNEIQDLRRQLIIQRNQKSLSNNGNHI